jgi:hypothetical protein
MNKRAVIFMVVLLLSLGLATSTLAGGVYDSGFCASQGGTWSGSDSLNGTCTYAANNATAIGACGADTAYEVFITSGFQTSSNCDSGSVSTPPPPGPEADCDAAGGSWSGSDSDNGECTYAANSAAALFSCAADEELVEFYVSGSFTHRECNSVGSGSGSGSDEDSDESNKETKKDSDEPVTLVLGGGKNGDATFPPETCTQKCTITSNLPGPAKSSIPGDAIGTMYVRVVQDGGEPGSGTYLVCFNNPDTRPVTIYRYISGAWVAVTFASSSSRICVTASGDGAFYLG